MDRDAVRGDAELWDVELAITAGRIDLLLARARGARSIAERRFALDALARALMAADPGAVSEAERRAALELRVDPSTVAAASAPRLPHAVAVPLVVKGGGTVKGGIGFVRQVHVAFDPVGLMADDLLDPSTLRASADAIAAAARIARPPSEPALHRLVAAQPGALSRARVEGRSLGAATLVSAISLWTDRPVRADVVVTGALAGHAIASVGDVRAKVEAAHAHRAAHVVVPSADAAEARRAAASLEHGPNVIAVADVEALLEATLASASGPRVQPERAVAEARRLFASGWRGYRWPTVRDTYSRLSGTLPEARLDLRVEVLTRLAAAQRHLGDPVGSLALLEEAAVMARSLEGRLAVPDAPITVLYQQTAMTHRQLCRFGDASRAAERGARVARSARLRGELIKALGCAGLVAMARGRVEQAVDAFERSLEVTLAHDPHRTARTHAYLIEAHAAAGDAAEAERHFDAAMNELAQVEEAEERRSRESWVRTSWGGGLVRLGRPEEAVAILDVPSVRTSLTDEPLPGLLARRHLGLALIASGAEERGAEVLAASPLAHGRALEPHLRFLAHLNVLFEARARIASDRWGPDIAGRAAAALLHVPRYGRVEAHLGKPLERVRRMLADPRPPRSARSLDALLERCAQLA